MPVTKKAPAKTDAKPEVKAPAAPKAAPAKAPEVKEVKAAAAPKAAAPKAPKAKAPAAKKPAAKKPAAPKAAAPKAAAKAPAAVKAEVYVQFGGASVSVDEIVKNVKIANGKEPKELKVYIKPDSSKAYYVADGVEKEIDVYFIG
jgi:hypothetical protein